LPLAIMTANSRRPSPIRNVRDKFSTPPDP
jgi:hypothetical protein